MLDVGEVVWRKAGNRVSQAVEAGFPCPSRPGFWNLVIGGGSTGREGAPEQDQKAKTPTIQRAVPRKSRWLVSEVPNLRSEEEGFRLNRRSHVVGRGEQKDELAFLIPYTHPVPLPLFLQVSVRISC